MCINDTGWKGKKNILMFTITQWGLKGPSYGETCTIMKETEFGYVLSEYGANDEYDKNEFIPLEDGFPWELLNNTLVTTPKPHHYV